MKAKITRTSGVTASVDSVVLKETSTTRLILKPMIVHNQNDLHRPVRGELLWQRRKPSDADEWEDESNLRLANMTAGSGVKLTLASDELFLLTAAVRGLYGYFWSNNWKLPVGTVEVNLLDHAQMAISLDALGTAAKAIESAGTAGVVEVLEHLASPDQASVLLKALPQIATVDLAKLNSYSGIELLKQALTVWRDNQSQPQPEAFWHQTLVDFSFVLSQVFSTPVTVFKSKAYVGGKNIDNAGGKLPDFLLKNELTKHVLIVEIKTPQTELLDSTVYRSPDVFAVSREVAGAIGQIAKYKAEFLHNYSELLRKAGDDRFLLADPRCLVIVGDTAQLDSDDQRDSFEHFRRGQRGTEIITFDELFKKVDLMIELLEGTH